MLNESDEERLRFSFKNGPNGPLNDRQKPNVGPNGRPGFSRPNIGRPVNNEVLSDDTYDFEDSGPPTRPLGGRPASPQGGGGRLRQKGTPPGGNKGQGQKQPVLNEDPRDYDDSEELDVPEAAGPPPKGNKNPVLNQGPRPGPKNRPGGRKPNFNQNNDLTLSSDDDDDAFFGQDSNEPPTPPRRPNNGPGRGPPRGKNGGPGRKPGNC
jgi:hypothetical protein